MTLAVGPHRLEAEGEGYVPFRADMIISPGPNPPISVKLKSRPSPTPAIVAAPTVPTDAAPKGALAATDPPLATRAPDPVPQPSPPIAAAAVEDRPAEKTEAEVAAQEDKQVEELGKPGPKNAQPKKNATLTQIAGDPASYLDHILIPTDLFLVNTRLGNRMGPANGLAVKTFGVGFQDVQKAGIKFELVLKPELADHLREVVNQQKSLILGEYPASVRLKVVKDPRNPGDYLGVVDWIELLVYIDPRFIAFGSSQFNKAFFVESITEHGCQLAYSVNYEVWKTKLGPSHVIPNLKVAYVKEQKSDGGLRFKQWAHQVVNNTAQRAAFFHDLMLKNLFH